MTDPLQEQLSKPGNKPGFFYVAMSDFALTEKKGMLK
jgi:hypothetical protein